MSERLRAVRGAVSVPKDDREALVGAVSRLMDALAEANGFGPDDLVSLQFTQTSDLRSANAAGALREGRPAYGAAPLFCAQEPEFEGSLPRTVRVLATWYGAAGGKPVYLGEARRLRPDLAGD